MKKNWHFKKWLQNLILGVASVSGILLISFDSVDFTQRSTWIILAILLTNTIGGAVLLSRHGRFN